MMHERERNQTTDTSTLSNNRQQRQQLTSWEIQNGIHRTRCMRGRENQTTDTSTLSNNSQQWQQLTRWVIQNGIHRTRCMRGREIKQQTHQHWVTTDNNDNNLPTGWFKMAFTEHDAWEGEKSNNRHINTELQQSTMTTTYLLGDSKWHSQNTMHERERKSNNRHINTE